MKARALFFKRGTAPRVSACAGISAGRNGTWPSDQRDLCLGKLKSLSLRLLNSDPPPVGRLSIGNVDSFEHCHEPYAKFHCGFAGAANRLLSNFLSRKVLPSEDRR